MYKEADSVLTAEYSGDGIWTITKTCPVNSEHDSAWYFYDDTNELVWKRDLMPNDVEGTEVKSE